MSFLTGYQNSVVRLVWCKLAKTVARVGAWGCGKSFVEGIVNRDAVRS